MVLLLLLKIRKKFIFILFEISYIVVIISYTTF